MIQQTEFIHIVFTVAQLALIGVPYALKICTMYGRIACIPENWHMKKPNSSNMNGFIVRLRFSSLNFCSVVGAGCGHFFCAFTHTGHELENSLYRCNAWNSF